MTYAISSWHTILNALPKNTGALWPWHKDRNMFCELKSVDIHFSHLRFKSSQFFIHQCFWTLIQDEAMLFPERFYCTVHCIILHLSWNHMCACTKKMVKKCEGTNEGYSKRNSINASNLDSINGKCIWLPITKTLKATLLIKLYIYTRVLQDINSGKFTKATHHTSLIKQCWTEHSNAII